MGDDNLVLHHHADIRNGFKRAKHKKNLLLATIIFEMENFYAGETDFFPFSHPKYILEENCFIYVNAS